MRAIPRLFTVLAVTSLIATLIPAFATASPLYTAEERAEAIIRPSLILIQVRAKGFIRNKTSGELVTPDAVLGYYRCSGFAVTPDGYVVTAGNCAKPSPGALKAVAFGAYADQLIGKQQLASTAKTAFIANLQATADFTGAAKDSAPEAQIYGQQNAVSGISAGVSATVVASRPLAEGNVTLLKLSIDGLPVVQLGASSLALDSQVLVLGYTLVGAETYAPRSQLVKIVNLGASSIKPSKVDGDVGMASHGGMVADLNGKVIGVVVPDTDLANQPRRAYTSIDVVAGLLSQAGVSSTLSPRDQAYRAGLDAYFGGRYGEAIAKFDEVLLISVGDMETAARYRQNAVDRRAIEGDRADARQTMTPMLAGLLGVGATVIALGIAGGLYLAVARGRARRTATDPYAPVSGVPGPYYPAVTEHPADQNSPWAQQPPPADEDS